LNLDQIPNTVLKQFDSEGGFEIIEKWINDNSGHDAQVCDCCGDGEGWYSGQKPLHQRRPPWA